MLDKTKTKLIAGIVVLALVVTAFTVISAQTNSGDSAPMGQGGRFGGAWGMNQLTDEEREDIQQQLQDYRQDLLGQYGITLTEEQREAIRQAMQEQRQGMRQQMHEFRQGLFDHYEKPLTAEEREEIREQMQTQKEEMQQEMQELCEQYGIDLTDDEKEEIRQQMQAFRQELFEEYGIPCPDGTHGAGAWGHGQRGWMGQGMQGFRCGSGLGWVTPTPNPEE